MVVARYGCSVTALPLALMALPRTHCHELAWHCRDTSMTQRALSCDWAMTQYRDTAMRHNHHGSTTKARGSCHGPARTIIMARVVAPPWHATWVHCHRFFIALPLDCRGWIAIGLFPSTAIRGVHAMALPSVMSLPWASPRAFTGISQCLPWSLIGRQGTSVGSRGPSRNCDGTAIA